MQVFDPLMVNKFGNLILDTKILATNIIALIQGANPQLNGLIAELRQSTPRFFALGGNNGRMVLVIDPRPASRGRVAPFVLSDEAPSRMLYREAVGWNENGVYHLGYCERIGARLPTRKELEAIILGVSSSNEGSYDQNAIAGLSGTYVWSSTQSLLFPQFAFSLDGSCGFIGVGICDDSLSVRCVRSFDNFSIQ